MSNTQKSTKNLHTTMLGRQVEMRDRNDNPFYGEIVNVYLSKDRSGNVAPHYSVEFLPGVNVGWNESTNSRVLEINLEDELNAHRGTAILVPKE